MRGFPRAAALSAAAFLFAAGGLAGPAIAQQANATPAFVPAHEGSSLSSETAGIAGAFGPSANIDVTGSQIPVVTHAIAPLPAQDLLDRQPDDSATSRHASRSLADLVGDY